MSTLIVKDGPMAGRRITVASEMSIGREGADFTLDDAEASRRHSLLRPSGDGVEIEDAGSTNGTFVNGNRISGATRLNPGDTVKIGQTTFEVETASRSGQTVAAPAWTPGATKASPIPQMPSTPAPSSQPPPAAQPPPYSPPSQPQPQYSPPSQPQPQYGAPQGTPGYPPTQPQPGGYYPPTGPSGAVRPKGPKKSNRTPLLIGGAVLLVILLGLGAFLLLGGDDAPSKAEFIAAADKICGTANQKAQKVDIDFTNPQGLKKGFGELVNISEEMLDDLKALDRPEEDAAILNQFFGAFDDVNKDLRQLGDVIDSQNIDQITTVSNKVEKDAKRLDTAAKDFGFDKCRDTANV